MTTVTTDICVFLEDVLDVNLLRQMIDEGYVSERFHDTEPLVIYNYTDKATYARKWNEVTRKTRGLIVNTDTNEVVARPFEKFFNYGEPGAPLLDLDAFVYVREKFDGSLGIGYQLPSTGEWRIATRGSFHSEQADYANQHFLEHYGTANAFLEAGDDWTPLFEIIYRENRIVVDYGNTEGLELLAFVRKGAGRMKLPEVTEPFRFADALNEPIQPNHEGWVLYGLRGEMVKIKSEEYLKLHKAKYGLTTKFLWERHRDGESFEGILQSIPEEFRQWAKNELQLMNLRTAGLLEEALTLLEEIAQRTGCDPHHPAMRKDVGKLLQGEPLAPAVFMLIDDKDKQLNGWLWKQVKPSKAKAYAEEPAE